MSKRFGHIEHNLHLAIATFLDPRFKTINFTNPIIAIANVIKKVKSLVKTDASQLGDESSEEQNNSKPDVYDFWQQHKMLAHGKPKG